jgi:hypothetical protein
MWLDSLDSVILAPFFFFKYVDFNFEAHGFVGLWFQSPVQRSHQSPGMQMGLINDTWHDGNRANSDCISSNFLFKLINLGSNCLKIYVGFTYLNKFEDTRLLIWRGEFYLDFDKIVKPFEYSLSCEVTKL